MIKFTLKPHRHFTAANLKQKHKFARGTVPPSQLHVNKIKAPPLTAQAKSKKRISAALAKCQNKIPR